MLNSFKDTLQKKWRGTSPPVDGPGSFDQPDVLTIWEQLVKVKNKIYSSFSTKSSICGSSFVFRTDFVLRTVDDALRRKRSAGWTPRAEAILSIISKEGNVRPHSIQPMVPVAQSHDSANFS